MTGFGSPCGACKFLRRKCVRGCVFAPYFCHEQGAAHFAAIHKVFGASNFSKLLLHLPAADRSEAAVTIAYEAQARIQDPVYGCVSHIFALQQQVVNLQAQLASLKSQAAAANHLAPHQATQLVQGQALPHLPLNPSFMSAFSMSTSLASYGDHAAGFAAEDEGSEFAMAAASSPEEAALEGSSSYDWRSGGGNHNDMEDLQSVALAYLGRSS